MSSDDSSDVVHNNSSHATARFNVPELKLTVSIDGSNHDSSSATTPSPSPSPSSSFGIEADSHGGMGSSFGSNISSMDGTFTSSSFLTLTDGTDGSLSPYSTNESMEHFDSKSPRVGTCMSESGLNSPQSCSASSSRETSPRLEREIKLRLKESEKEKKKQRFLERSLEKSTKETPLPTIQSMPSLFNSDASLPLKSPRDLSSPRIDPEMQIQLKVLHPNETDAAVLFDHFSPEGCRGLLPKVELKIGRFTDEGIFDVDCLVLPISLTPKNFYSPLMKTITTVLGEGLVERLKKVYSRGFGILPPNYTVLVPVVSGGSRIGSGDDGASMTRRGTITSAPTSISLKGCSLNYVLCVAVWKLDNSNRNPAILKDAFRAALMELDLHNTRMVSGGSSIDGASYAARHKYIYRVLTPAFTSPEITCIDPCAEAMGKVFWQYAKYRGYPNVPPTYTEGNFRKAFKEGFNQQRGLANVKELHKLISLAANTTREYKDDVQSNALKHLNFLLQRKQSVQIYWTRDNVLQQIRNQHLQLHATLQQNEKEKEKPTSSIPYLRRSSTAGSTERLAVPAIVVQPEHSWLEALVDRAVEAPPDKTRFQPWIPFDSVEEGSLLGRGTYGKVKRAILTSRNENGEVEKTAVALKTVEFSSFRDPKITTKIHKEVMREAIIMSVCRHPRVLPCFGAKFTDARVDILTEIADGDLFKFLAKSPPSSQRLRIAQQIAEGMMYMHSFNYMHRDLKSLNVLVFIRGETVDIKISDFGSARIIDFTMSADVGTPRWTAPEVMAGKDYTKKADVFSFGLVMWEILAMAPPYSDFKGTSFILTTKITEGLRPSVPSPIQNDPYVVLMKKCWDPNPTTRPSFSEILAALLQVHDIPAFEAKVVLKDSLTKKSKN